MKGKNPTRRQKEFHNQIAACGCAACWEVFGENNDWGSIHHCAGRASERAIWFTLFLCDSHHQKGTGNNTAFPAIHGDAWRFRDDIGTEEELYVKTIDRLLDQGATVPQEALDLAEEFRTGAASRL